MNGSRSSCSSCSNWPLSGFPDEACDSLDQQIEVIQRAGLRHIDLRGVDGANIVDLPLDTARRYKQRLDEAGLTVNMFGTPIGKIDVTDDIHTDLGRLDHLASLADIFDCRQIRIFSYYNKTSMDKAAWRNEAIERLGRLKNRAASLNLVLFHENEREIFGDLCDDVSAILDAHHDRKTFKSIFDFDNFNQGGENVWQCWLKLRDRTDAFHLKDSDHQGQHVPIGQGAGRAGDIFADALERGFTGPLSLEPHLAHSPAVMATGPSGRANQTLKDMTPTEVWLLAAHAARKLLGDLNVPVG